MEKGKIGGSREKEWGWEENETLLIY